VSIEEVRCAVCHGTLKYTYWTVHGLLDVEPCPTCKCSCPVHRQVSK